MVAGRSNDMKTALSIAQDTIDSGKAAGKLEEIRKVSNNL
jgi:anthranilate phosphoribosyltransferase